jgi:steroid delta-isomerase-like uncharacterized protein
MGEQENKELVNRFLEEVFNKHNLAFADETISEDGVEHDPLPGLSEDKKGAMQTLGALLAAFPDQKVEVHHLIASGDKVAVNSTVRGTHEGEFMGVPPTGKTVEIGGIDIVRIDGGKFQEHWGVFDAAGLMMQLGVIQPPPTPGEHQH